MNEYDDIGALCRLCDDLIAERDALREALLEARQFIVNGIELGYIATTQPGTRESKCLPMIEAALHKAKGS